MHRAMIEKCIQPLTPSQRPLSGRVLTFFIMQMEPFDLSLAPNHLS